MDTFSLSSLLRRAYQEGVFDSACDIIRKSATLLFILSKELGYAQHKKPQHHHRQAMPQFPEKDPYAVLELARDASDKRVATSL